MPLNKNKRSSQQSLARKLAILYASTTFSVLLIASGLLYWSLLDHLQKEHESLVTAKIIELRHYFKSSSLLGETLYGLIDAEHHHSEATHSSAIHPSIPHHVFVRIFDEQNNLLVESNLPPTVPRSLNFPLVDSKSTQSISITKELSKTDQFFLLGSAWAQTTSDQQPRQVLIQAVLQLAPDESLLTAFQRTLSAVLIFGVIASALSGYWVTRRGLRPLRQITKTIHNINAHQLNEQVNSGQWPEEIGVYEE